MKIFKSTLTTNNTDNNITITSAKNCFSFDDINYIQNLPKNIDHNDIWQERQKIEKCASSSKTYYYNSNWDKNVISQLKEYAIICKCNIVGVNPESKDFLEKVASINETKKIVLAAVKSNTPPPESSKNILSEALDPFKFLTKTEQTNKLDKLSSLSIVENYKKNKIINIRGGEDYLKNNTFGIRSGQNSIFHPDIFINHKNQDNKSIFIQDKKEKENKHKNDILTREKQLVLDMKKAGLGALPTSNVKVTGLLFDQYASKPTFLPQNLPTRTLGEKFADVNLKRKNKKKEDIKELNTPKPQKRFTVGELLDINILQKIIKRTP